MILIQQLHYPDHVACLVVYQPLPRYIHPVFDWNDQNANSSMKTKWTKGYSTSPDTSQHTALRPDVVPPLTGSMCAHDDRLT